MKSNDGVQEKEQSTISNISKANRVAGCSIQLLEPQLQNNKQLSKVEPQLIRLEELKVNLQSIGGTIGKIENHSVWSCIS